MAISATFYQNNKKINSTKRPTSSATDIVLSVELKDVTDLFTPTLVISADTFMSGGSITNPMKYNYCYLPDFERYYFVRSWSWILGRWECALEVDVLATFKTEIGSSSLYILRSASQCDPDIIDTKYPVKAADSGNPYQGRTYESGGKYSLWNTNIYSAAIGEGFYLVSIVNNDSGAIGAISHYAFTAAAMAELMNKLYSAPTWMGITDVNISTDLQKMLFNPMQYITNVMWIPTGFTTSGATGITTIPYGWWSLTLTNTVYKINTTNVKKTLTASFPVTHHPQYNATYRRWVQLSPYTTCALYLQPFGFIPLDTSKLYGSEYIDVTIELDVITGKGTINIGSHRTENGVQITGGTIYSSVSQIGVPISIAQMSVDMSALGQASTWVGAAGVALAAGGIQDSLKELSNNLINGAKELFSNAQSRVSTENKLNPNYMSAAGKSAYAGLMAGQRYAAGAPASAADAILAGAQAGANSVGSGTSLLSTLKEIAGDIGSAALAAAGTCQSSGSTGGFAALMEMMYIQWYFQKVVDDDNTHYGRPLCRIVTPLSTLSGFILCANGDDLSLPCTPAERQAVCAFMEAGFYYE